MRSRLYRFGMAVVLSSSPFNALKSLLFYVPFSYPSLALIPPHGWAVIGVLARGGASCRMHCTEQNVAATLRKSFAASRKCAPHPKSETTIRGRRKAD